MFLRGSFTRLTSKQVKWYQYVSEIRYHEMKFDLSESDALGFFYNLISIRFSAVNIIGLSDRLLQPFKHSIKMVLLDTVPPNTTVNYLFDSERMWNIIDLYLTSTSATRKPITPNNFSNLPMLEQLTLTHFGIETIKPHSFDLLNFLRILDLGNNRLKSIKSELFHRLISSTHVQQVRIILSQNPLNCNCETIKLVGIYKTNDMANQNLLLGIDCFAEPDISINYKECGLQLIRGHRLCFTSLRFFYPKFLLRLDQAKHEIIIETDVIDRYRILMLSLSAQSMDYNINIKQQKRYCPRKQTFELILRCLFFTNGSAIISLKVLIHQLNIIGICVNYVTRSTTKIWPLHCITYSQKTDLSGDDFYGILIVVIIASTTGILAGLLSIISTYSRCPPMQKFKVDTNRKVQTIMRNTYDDIDIENFYENPDYEFITAYDYLQSDCDKINCANSNQHAIYSRRNSIYECEK